MNIITLLFAFIAGFAFGWFIFALIALDDDETEGNDDEL